MRTTWNGSLSFGLVSIPDGYGDLRSAIHIRQAMVVVVRGGARARAAPFQAPPASPGPSEEPEAVESASPGMALSRTYS